MQSQFVADATQLLKVGDKVKVELIEVTDRLKGSLKKHEWGDKSQPPPPQKGRRSERKRGAQYSPEALYDGFVTRLSSEGAFVTFDDGKASGFLPIGEIMTPEGIDFENVKVRDLLSKDDGVSVR